MLREWEQKAVEGYVERAHGTTDYKAVGRAPMLWSGWEADTDAVLLRLGDGGQAWFVLHCVDVAPDMVVDTLRQRLVAYREAITETEALLRLAGET